MHQQMTAGVADLRPLRLKPSGHTPATVCGESSASSGHQTSKRGGGVTHSRLQPSPKLIHLLIKFSDQRLSTPPPQA